MIYCMLHILGMLLHVLQCDINLFMTHEAIMTLFPQNRFDHLHTCQDPLGINVQLHAVTVDFTSTYLHPSNIIVLTKTTRKRKDTISHNFLFG